MNTFGCSRWLFGWPLSISRDTPHHNRLIRDGLKNGRCWFRSDHNGKTTIKTMAVRQFEKKKKRHTHQKIIHCTEFLFYFFHRQSHVFFSLSGVDDFRNSRVYSDSSNCVAAVTDFCYVSSFICQFISFSVRCCWCAFLYYLFCILITFHCVCVLNEWVYKMSTSSSNTTQNSFHSDEDRKKTSIFWTKVTFPVFFSSFYLLPTMRVLVVVITAGFPNFICSYIFTFCL